MDGEEHFEVAEILDSKVDRRYKDRLRYYIRWAGFEGTDDEFAWVGSIDAAGLPELLAEFHARYPHKIGPTV